MEDQQILVVTGADIIHMYALINNNGFIGSYSFGQNSGSIEINGAGQFNPKLSFSYKIADGNSANQRVDIDIDIRDDTVAVGGQNDQNDPGDSEDGGVLTVSGLCKITRYRLNGYGSCDFLKPQSLATPTQGSLVVGNDDIFLSPKIFIDYEIIDGRCIKIDFNIEEYYADIGVIPIARMLRPPGDAYRIENNSDVVMTYDSDSTEDTDGTEDTNSVSYDSDDGSEYEIYYPENTETNADRLRKLYNITNVDINIFGDANNDYPIVQKNKSNPMIDITATEKILEKLSKY